MPTYIIERRDGKAFEVIEGQALIYDEDQADTEAKKAQVKKVKDKFKEVKDSPHTSYLAVEIGSSTILGGNTGSRP
jgi:hypothetical protein